MQTPSFKTMHHLSDTIIVSRDPCTEKLFQNRLMESVTIGSRFDCL